MTAHIVQQGMIFKIGGLFQWLGAVEQHWRAYGDQHFVAQFVGPEPGPVALTIVNRHIHIVGQGAELGIHRLDPHIDIGILLTEFCQTRHQPLNGKAGRHADSQGTHGATSQQPVSGIRQLGKNILDIEEVALPFFGQ